MLESQAQLHAALTGHLERLAQAGDPGLYITALAHALILREVPGPLQEALHRAFLILGAEVRRRSRPGPPEDAVVMRRLTATGWSNLTPTRSRREGLWMVRYHPVRAMRPRRMAAADVRAVRAPFDPGGFHFALPHVQPECLGVEEIAGRPVHLFPNRYPFAPCHLLLLPDRDRLRPQFLTEETTGWAWEAAARLGACLPGALLGYNAIGAFGSVNHLHFHMVMEKHGMPVMQNEWAHNGGEKPYPAAVEACESAEAAWAAVDRLQRGSVAFNALFAGGRAYLFPRRFQADCHHAGWTTGFAFYELTGGMVAASSDAFERLTEAEITREFEVVRL